MTQSNRRSLLVVTALLAASVAGCSSDATSTPAPASPAPSGSPPATPPPAPPAPPPTSTPPVVANRDLASLAFDAVFNQKNLAAVDTYFAPAFIRHDPAASADGTVAFAKQVGALPSGVKWTASRTFAQGDLVLMHDTYDNLPQAGARTVSFDLLRFASGKIAEHWTCTEVDPGKYASGHTMIDGATAIDAAADTNASADVVVTPGKGFVPVVIIGGAFQRLPDFLAPTFVQHNPLIADGIDGVGAAFAQPPLNTIHDYAIPESLSEHDFVFTRSKGTLTLDAQKPSSPDNPTVYCDLFRVAGGKIVEHWDVIQLDPNSSSLDDVKTNGAGHTLWD